MNERCRRMQQSCLVQATFSRCAVLRAGARVRIHECIALVATTRTRHCGVDRAAYNRPHMGTESSGSEKRRRARETTSVPILYSAAGLFFHLLRSGGACQSFGRLSPAARNDARRSRRLLQAQKARSDATRNAIAASEYVARASER